MWSNVTRYLKMGTAVVMCCTVIALLGYLHDSDDPPVSLEKTSADSGSSLKHIDDEMDVGGPVDSTDGVNTNRLQLSKAEENNANGLVEASVNSSGEKAASFPANPVHPWRKTLQKRMKEETPEETFLRLADNDSQMLLAPLMGSIWFSWGMYPSDIRAVCRMTRIRKLLVEARENPERVTTFMLDHLKAMLRDFPRVHEEDTTIALREMKKRGDGCWVTRGPDRTLVYRIRSVAAVYVCSEINAFSALPTLAQLSLQGEAREDSPEYINNCLINRKFLFYAMHRLIKHFPAERLSTKARQARDAYLAKERDWNQSKLQKYKGTTWDAQYHERDYRRTLPDSRLNMDTQSEIGMTMFPRLEDLSTRNVEDLLTDMREFIELAFE